MKIYDCGRDAVDLDEVVGLRWMGFGLETGKDVWRVCFRSGQNLDVSSNGLRRALLERWKDFEYEEDKGC